MERVAITGFGVVSPVGIGREAFWRGLAEGRSGIDRISRFDCSTFDVQLAGEVTEPLDLPDDVALVAAEDPKVGFGFAACSEALEQAGIEGMNGSTLLHLGTSLEIFDLRKVICNGRADFSAVARQALAEDGPILQIPLDTASRLVCDHFGAPARNLVNCSACAAGVQTVGHGFRGVRSGEWQVAVCGGFDSMLNPLGVGGFQILGALTVDNNLCERACRPFDAGRSGTVLGEGAAVMVLEPLEKAKAKGKSILAEVCGYGSTLDAYKLSAPDPKGEGAARSMRDALADAGVEPESIGHINTHGTGTWLNDSVEAAAIRRVFDGVWERIPVSSTKSMTGHMIAAAGAVEIGACLLPLLQGVVPPNPSLDKIDEGCELAHVVDEAATFDGEYALTNSFGFGGQNATLILRRYDG